MKSFYISTIRIFLFILFTSIINISNAQTDDDSEWEEIILNSDSSYTDGKDIIFIIDDSIGTEEAMRLNNNIESGNYNKGTNIINYQLIVPPPNNNILIQPRAMLKNVAMGQHGLHIGGAFDNNTIPNDSSAMDQWNWLSELAPKVLRFPSGANNKFMHLLDGPGYGYNPLEMIKYYDNTDGVTDFPVVDFAALGDVLDDNRDSLELWINESEVSNFESLFGKWTNQLDLSSTHRYIDDFITLVEKIETDNPGHVVDVIVCLNIISEPASVCKQIVEYMRSNSIHNVNVVGVEFGNEVGAKWSVSMMGWDCFNEYYSFLKGESGAWDSVLSTTMQSDHDFFYQFKAISSFSCKVGIPAENLPGDFAFRMPADDGPREGCSWNDSLRAHYSDNTITISGGSRYNFDAVILHPYYDAENNWGDLMSNNLYANYSCNLGDSDSTNDYWLYGMYDPRLYNAFDSIGLNFQSLIKTKYLESYNEHNTVLNFNLSGPIAKNLWVTECNLKTNIKGVNDSINDKINAITQTWQHSMVFQEWYLKNIKLNFTTGYRTNFFTYTTWQNYAGGSGTDFISPANREELDSLGKYVFPYNLSTSDTAFRNYYVKRTTHYSFELLSVIVKENLKYVPSFFALNKKERNLNPTVFMDPAKENLYIFYSNVKGNSQNYKLSTTELPDLFPGSDWVDADTATIYYMQGLKPYSTSGKGKNTLFDINACYSTNPFPLGITHLDTMINIPECDSTVGANLCLTAPSYSMGYFKVPIQSHSYPPGGAKLNAENQDKLIVYPNPSSNYFYFFTTNPGEYESTEWDIKISTVSGVFIKKLVLYHFRQ
ncbi:MAG: hypothetical protein IPL48_16070 [Bacteroidetes bacterium]|nr:hypothetical protein [Bacteroidota bacterium]